ncbi:type II secretion system F family protein [Mycolicibacter arupensis]|jgi:tight adherence protein B|uniref:Type II secretion system protein GspF domain-containing protein n=3 Tax=Mycolicibacter arupensis TaxID=342002 RepID=A0ABX3RU50_9MYCO|nr:hypothetical protein [Mycolicibacter arupensis]MCV7274967.1 hypothetical protein [Mycolicibacter arupensis]OQZ97414.1 hypothetical protein BST15_10410 [Mycolicibacter arupensis]
MIGPASSALALAMALLLGVSPRGRLAPDSRPRHGQGRRGAVRWGLISVTIGAVALAGIVLPLGVWLAGLVVVATAAVRRRRSSRHRRAAAESRAWEAALEVLAGELRIGAHPLRAFAVAAAESTHRGVAAGLGGVAARARLGADVAHGLRDAARASALPGQWERLAAYWELGGRHGVAIASLMQAAQNDMTARHRFSARTAAGMAGARASATLLAGLPVLGVLLGQVIGARPVPFLLSESGGVLALIGVSLVCAGLLWSDRITSGLGGGA